MCTKLCQHPHEDEKAEKSIWPKLFPLSTKSPCSISSHDMGCTSHSQDLSLWSNISNSASHPRCSLCPVHPGIGSRLSTAPYWIISWKMDRRIDGYLCIFVRRTASGTPGVNMNVWWPFTGAAIRWGVLLLFAECAWQVHAITVTRLVLPSTRCTE